MFYPKNHKYISLMMQLNSFSYCSLPFCFITLKRGGGGGGDRDQLTFKGL